MASVVFSNKPRRICWTRRLPIFKYLYSHSFTVAFTSGFGKMSCYKKYE